MDRKEAVTILQEKRDLARMLEAAEKSADWVAKDRVDSSSLRASQHGRYADALDMAISALSPPNEPLTLGLVDKYGAPLYAGDTVAADKFFMYAIRYGSHNVNPKQCEPTYQVGWYLEIVWALYNEDKTYIGHTEALYDIGGVAARYPAHCADTTEGVQNLLLYKHRPPEVSPGDTSTHAQSWNPSPRRPQSTLREQG